MSNDNVDADRNPRISAEYRTQVEKSDEIVSANIKALGNQGEALKALGQRIGRLKVRNRQSVVFQKALDAHQQYITHLIAATTKGSRVMKDIADRLALGSKNLDSAGESNAKRGRGIIESAPGQPAERRR